VEVPRTLAFSGLCRKLTLLYGVGKDAPADCMPFTLLIARGAQAATLPDEVVCRSEVLEREKLNWETIEDQATWTKLTSHTEKYLLKIIPLPPTTVQSTTAVASSSSSATPAPATTPIPRHLLVQHVIPRKAPGPWPKFAPVPGTLPVIVYSGESEHEWEMLEEGEFEKMELEQLECKSEKPVANAKPAGKAATVVSKPNRTIPAELYAKLKGANLGANATPTPTTTVTFSVNKQMYTVNSPSPTLKLIEYLRYEIGITGSKIGCGEGGCGACTVVLSKTNAQTGLPVQFSTKACLHPVAALDGWSITTVEGLGNEHTGLHPIQQAMIDNWATQCGYW
jgi:aerobic-type carbon monoxide dehydrogenase small subunit (CoxS/CutS family)